MSSGAVVAIVSLAVLGLAGCASGDGESDSTMDRCRGGRTMTVTDPAADNLIIPSSNDVQNLASLRPRSFDIQRVTIATTNTMLCASVTFAQRDRVLKPGQFTRRHIMLELAPAKPRRSDTRGVYLARLVYGHGQNLTDWIPNGAIANDEEPFPGGEQITGAQGREVQLAVPVRELNRVAGYPAHPSRLDPRSFAWRISVASDCAPGPRQLTTFPSGRRLSLPGNPASASCR